MSITQAELDKLNDEHCPAELTLSGEPNDGSHCECWWMAMVVAAATVQP